MLHGCDRCHMQCDLNVPTNTAQGPHGYWHVASKNKLGLRKGKLARNEAYVSMQGGATRGEGE